jgi:UDP-glucose 4-epimerase
MPWHHRRQLMTYEKALVTGGAGFIGSHLVDRLLSDGLQVAVLDNLSTGKRTNLPPEAHLILGDVRDPAIVGAAVSGADVVFHLAARVSIRASVDDFWQDAETNLLGTLTVLRACVSRKVKKLVYASSMAVYADAPQPVPVSEDYSTAPISPYGIAKLASEQYATLVAGQSGFDAVALRYFNTYGPRQTFTPYVGVITIFIQQLLRGERPVIFGDGEQCRDFVYVGDIVDATIRAMTSDVSGEVFNVGSGRGMSVNQIAVLLCERLAPQIAPQHVAAHPGELRNSIANIDKARRLLGYEPYGRLEDKIDELIAWNQELA